ncbi:MAG TPA: hypothetical protein VNP36_10040 [Burkholderiales bacterium]|nr:hypothetical protein [Burkholderiales bacterium]
MQGPVRLRLFVALLLSLAAAAFAAEAELSAEVPAEKWRALRLKGLTQGASLRVRVETSGPIRVILARENEVQRFPKGLKATFSGTAERRLSFSVSIPAAGTYYVILDNRKGDALREVRVYVEALPARRPPPKPKPKPKSEPGMSET